MPPSLSSPRSLTASLRARLVPRRTGAVAPFARYADDPVGFFRDVLGVEPWGRHVDLPAAQASQIDMILAVRDHDATASRSGHKTGKALCVNTQIPTPSGWSSMG